MSIEHEARAYLFSNIDSLTERVGLSADTFTVVMCSAVIRGGSIE
ncbi:hypothetical protein [Burkholderia sp. IMCC1007]|nr:hypothetical protein [Burkholderia sp. IMCC1007]